MKFTVIDDYVYWGIMGKYLFLNNHLPDSNTAIISRHLAYTPGTSLFHYFFYTLTGKYSPGISYFAQNILLMGPLFVVLQKENFKKGVVFLCALIIMLTLFSGSVFTKLQVDYLLSIYFFALLWIYFKNERPDWKILLTICVPVCFLFLIKEIGFLLGNLLLLIIFLDLFFHETLEKKQKIRLIIFVIVNGCLLFLMKYLWALHCQEMGFLQFNSAVNPESIKKSFDIFSDEYVRKGFLIFLKEVIIGPADRLNLPYVLWYALILFCWFRILNVKSFEGTRRYVRLIKIMLAFFMVYLLLMYFMQIIIFGVGKNYAHTVGMTRYMNIFFSQVVFFTVLLYSHRFFLKNGVPDKAVVFFVAAVILALGLSRVETSLRRELHFTEAENIAERVKEHIDVKKPYKLCLVPGEKDNHLGIKLLYHFLPSRINHGRFPDENKSQFLSALVDFDYVLLHYPGAKIRDWTTSLSDQKFEDLGFYQIERSGEKVIRLKKIFEISRAPK